MTVDEYVSRCTVVYVMRWANGHKIGCTSNLLSRYAARTCRSDVIHLIPVPVGMNMYAAEREVQDMFSYRRIGGDLFSLTDENLRDVKEFEFSGNQTLR